MKTSTAPNAANPIQTPGRPKFTNNSMTSADANARPFHERQPAVAADDVHAAGNDALFRPQRPREHRNEGVLDRLTVAEADFAAAEAIDCQADQVVLVETIVNRSK
jgi:hypothetical protein